MGNGKCLWTQASSSQYLLPQQHLLRRPHGTNSTVGIRHRQGLLRERCQRLECKSPPRGCWLSKIHCNILSQSSKTARDLRPSPSRNCQRTQSATATGGARWATRGSGQTRRPDQPATTGSLKWTVTGFDFSEPYDSIQWFLSHHGLYYTPSTVTDSHEVSKTALKVLLNNDILLNITICTVGPL